MVKCQQSLLKNQKNNLMFAYEIQLIEIQLDRLQHQRKSEIVTIHVIFSA